VRIEQIWVGVVPTREPSELRRMIVEYELSRHPCWPMPGSRRVIATLRRSGVALGVVSNAQFYTPLFLTALLGGQPEQLGFTRELCFYSWVHGEAKPAPGMFERAADELRGWGISRSEILFVGNDPMNDLGAGAKAGFMTAQVAVDRRSLVKSAPVSGGLRPNAILGRLADLLTLVNDAREASEGL
jgi:putative hydrolase of the HAD superfamily